MCIKNAKYRYTWPGNDEALACDGHASALSIIANTMGFHLQIIQLSELDQQLGQKCSSLDEVPEGEKL